VAGFNRQKESKCDSFFWNNDSQLPREGVTETKVENWTRWAFTEHKDKAIITDFLKTLQARSRKAEFSDGIPIASICSGWGVAEMVIDAINEVLDDVCPRSPKACVWKRIVCFESLQCVA